MLSWFYDFDCFCWGVKPYNNFRVRGRAYRRLRRRYLRASCKNLFGKVRTP